MSKIALENGGWFDITTATMVAELTHRKTKKGRATAYWQLFLTAKGAYVERVPDGRFYWRSAEQAENILTSRGFNMEKWRLGTIERQLAAFPATEEM